MRQTNIWSLLVAGFVFGALLWVAGAGFNAQIESAQDLHNKVQQSVEKEMRK